MKWKAFNIRWNIDDGDNYFLDRNLVIFECIHDNAQFIDIKENPKEIKKNNIFLPLKISNRR
jgi:hypothetical protein